MANRRVEYERVFEEYLRARRIPYVAVDEARKTLLPASHVRRRDDAAGCMVGGGSGDNRGLKSFDFVIYGEGGNLLVDVKGRTVAGSSTGRVSGGRGGGGRLESWVTRDDVESLSRWEALFGPGFEAVFIFVYRCERQPPDALFQEILADRGVWYALRAVRVGDYAEAMKPRSPRWRTVDIPSAVFERISGPFAPPLAGAPRSLRHTKACAANSGHSREWSMSDAWASDEFTGACAAGPEVPVLQPLG